MNMPKLFSADAEEIRNADEVLFSASKYEDNSKASLAAADKLVLKADEAPQRSSSDSEYIPDKEGKKSTRLDWIQNNFLPRLNTDYMKLEERKRINTCWICGILFQKHVVPRILMELNKIKNLPDKSVFMRHKSRDRNRWVRTQNKKWNIAYREGDWTCEKERFQRKCGAVNFAGNPVCWRRGCGAVRSGESLDKTVWNLENLTAKDWQIFDTAFPGELPAIKQYTENTGLSGWLLTNWFMAFVKYMLFLIVPTYPVGYVHPELYKGTANASHFSNFLVKRCNAVAGLANCGTETQRILREGDLKRKWIMSAGAHRMHSMYERDDPRYVDVETFELSNLSGVMRLVQRPFTTIEALFHAITTWYSSENETREMPFVTNDYGKSARINLLDFCRRFSKNAPTEQKIIIESIWAKFNAWADGDMTAKLPKKIVEIALHRIVQQGVSYIKYLRKKYKYNESPGIYFIVKRDTEFHLSQVLSPRQEIFMNDAEYDDTSCWLWKQFKQQYKEQEEAKLKPSLNLPMVPTHLRNIPLYQPWKMDLIRDPFGNVFEWAKGERIFAWTENVERSIEVDYTYLTQEKKMLHVLQTIAHEFGHAMSMFGRHAEQALFRPWARYFGETDPRQYDVRDMWIVQELPDASLVSKLEQRMKTLRL